MKKILILAVFLAALVSCDAWSQSQRDDAHAVVSKMVQEGSISPTQGEAMHEAIDDMADGTTLEDILAWVGTVLGSAGLALLGVRTTRGPAKPLDKDGAALLQALIASEKHKHQAGGSA